MIRALAAFVTLTAVGMAAVAAWDRGGSAIDRALLVAISVAICLGTHLIPALSKRKLAWLLWAGCLLGTTFGHVVFFTHSSLRAGEVRAMHAVQVVGTEKQIEAAREALAGITARPVAVVATELAATQGRRERSVLRLELAEAQRAAALRDEVVRLSGTSTAAQVTETGDVVFARLAAVTGSNADGIALLIALGFSVLLELVGAFLWCEALHSSANVSESTDTQPIAADPIASLRAAIAAGKCRGTVAGIRAHMGCGQSKAMALRRALGN